MFWIEVDIERDHDLPFPSVFVYGYGSTIPFLLRFFNLLSTNYKLIELVYYKKNKHSSIAYQAECRKCSFYDRWHVYISLLFKTSQKENTLITSDVYVGSVDQSNVQISLLFMNV